jgi:hypothetical protein
MECEACGFDTMYGHELDGCEVIRQEAASRGFDGSYAEEVPTLAEVNEALTDRCRHGIEYIIGGDTHPCVSCSRKRDSFASYRKADGEGRYVKPYAELSPTVRGAFSVGQVRAVITSGETETRQWTDASSEGDWASASDPDAPAYVQRRAHHEDKVPLWYRVTVRGATAPWPDPDAYDRGKYFAAITDYCTDTPDLEVQQHEDLIP